MGRGRVRHDGGMHLSSAEAVLAGAAITAAVALIAQHGARRGDHVARLWERRAGVYEEALFYVARWSEARRYAMAVLAGDERALEDMPDLGGDVEQERTARLLARLSLFGDPVVDVAFSRYQQAECEFSAAFAGWRECRGANREEVAAGVAPWEIDAGELKRRRSAVLAAHEAAGGGANEMGRVLRDAVGRVPGYRRRWWRQVPSVRRARGRCMFGVGGLRGGE